MHMKVWNAVVLSILTYCFTSSILWLQLHTYSKRTSTYTLIGAPWPGGYQARVCIPNTMNVVCGWTVALEFSPKISNLNVWNTAPNNTRGYIGPTTVQYIVSDLVYYNSVIPPNKDLCLEFVAKFNNDGIPFVRTLTGKFIYRCTPSTTTSPTISATTSLTSTIATKQSAMPSSTTTSSQITSTTASATTESGGIGNSHNLSQILELSILFYETQRSGKLPATNRIPWRGDSALNDVGHDWEDLTGGWYDAGDHLKLTFPMSAAVMYLLLGLHEWKDSYVASGQLEYMYDSVKWPMDYFLKSWNPETQKYYGQVGSVTLDHGTWGRAESMNMTRPAYAISPKSPGSDLAAGTAAALALGSIVFKSKDPVYAEQLLTTAVGLYEFANNYRRVYSYWITESHKVYKSSNYTDELCLAATWLYRATNQQKYLTDAESSVDSGLPVELSWDEKYPAAYLELYKITHKVRYLNLLTAFIDSYIGGIYTPCGLAWRMTWGSLRFSANVAMLALLSAEEGIKTDEYRNWALGQIWYMLGENPLRMSYVIGYGSKYPLNPHHRNSACRPAPSVCNWTTNSKDAVNAHVLHGALVGGPDQLDDYNDDRKDYVMNEVSVDYNSGFQSTIAGLLHLEITNQFPESSLSGCAK